MEQVKKILWIDDDIHRDFLRPYVDEFLDQGYEVIGINSADEIENVIVQHLPIAAIIVDVLMPPGESIDFFEAQGGLLTGYIIFQKLLDDKRLNETVKVAFTIIDNQKIEEFCNTNHIEYLKKNEYLADTFVSKINQILGLAENI
jgi:hypothetical protein